MKFLAVTLFSVLCLSVWAADRGDHGTPDRGRDNDRGHDRGGYDRDYHGYRPFVPVYPIYPVRPMGQYYISGYYETRTETILVEPERIEKVYVEPVYDTRYTADGKPVVVKVADGYYREIVIPAKYTTIQTRVFVPGYWATTPVRTCPPVMVQPRSGLDIDFFIGQRGSHTSWGLGLDIRP
jgi:hypothetical protein